MIENIHFNMITVIDLISAIDEQLKGRYWSSDCYNPEQLKYSGWDWKIFSAGKYIFISKNINQLINYSKAPYTIKDSKSEYDSWSGASNWAEGY